MVFMAEVTKYELWASESKKTQVLLWPHDPFYHRTKQQLPVDAELIGIIEATSFQEAWWKKVDFMLRRNPLTAEEEKLLQDIQGMLR